MPQIHWGCKHKPTDKARRKCERRRAEGAATRLDSSLGGTLTYIRDEAIRDAFDIFKDDWDQLGDQAKRIITEILPRFIGKFVEANKHYGSKNANVLGPAGQFADIWRKIGPLRRSLWEGVELTREGPDEICLDLIGHLLLTIDMIQQGVDRRGTGPVS